MAAITKCSLCRLPNYVQTKLENKKKPFLVFSIFLILLIEWFSIIYLQHVQITENVTDFYIVKIYPFLTQLSLFILFASLFLWKEKLRFCFRKSATTFYLSLYYLFGCVAILFCLQSEIYYTVVSYGSLGIASFIFLISLFKTND